MGEELCPEFTAFQDEFRKSANGFEARTFGDVDPLEAFVIMNCSFLSVRLRRCPEHRADRIRDIVFALISGDPNAMQSSAIVSGEASYIDAWTISGASDKRCWCSRVGHGFLLPSRPAFFPSRRGWTAERRVQPGVERRGARALGRRPQYDIFYRHPAALAV